MAVLAVLARFLGFAGAAAPPSAAALAVQASPENGEDSEDVVGKLALGGGVLVVLVHDDRRAVVLAYALDKVVCEAAQAVSVGNMHESYTARKDEFQKRHESFALEVESGGDVAEDGASRVLVFEAGELALEVGSLLAGGHAAVDDVDALGLGVLGVLCGLCGLGGLRGLSGPSGLVVWMCDTERGDVVEVVSAGPAWADGADVSRLGPPKQGSPGGAELLCGERCSQEPSITGLHSRVSGACARASPCVPLPNTTLC